jgi:hypothetical protein
MQGDLFLHFSVGAPDNLLEAAAYAEEAASRAVKGLLRKAALLQRRASRYLALGLLQSAHEQVVLSCLLFVLSLDD